MHVVLELQHRQNSELIIAPTTDQVFVLHHLIDKHRLGFGSAKGKLLYACFVDFKKAYDSVQRQLLFECLADLGVHGHYFGSCGTVVLAFSTADKASWTP